MPMRALDRKLLRDLRHHWSQVLSIAAVVGCGVMAVVALRSTLRSVERARDDYYARYRFADVFASVQRAPDALVPRIAALPGVGTADARVVLQVTLDVPRLEEPAVGQVVSVPDEHLPALDALHIRVGRYVAAGRADEVLLSERFAEQNRLAPGDTLGAVMNGRWQKLVVVGIASSPEFVYEIGANAFLVDNRRFGILWMGREAVAAVADMDGAFNNLAIRLAPGARAEHVIARLDALLRAYGGAGAYARRDQASHTVLTDEIAQMRTMAGIFPLFFLLTAAFLLNVVLSRLVETQREELAALKAFGYDNTAIALHYLGFAVASVAAGSVLGIVAGAWFGRVLTAMYATFFHFPRLDYGMQWGTAALSIAVSGGSALLGALGAVRRAVRLPPAEALRPPAPARFRPLLIERLGWQDLLTPSSRMVMRNLERRPVRSLVSIFGVSLAGALLVAGRYPYDGMDRMLDLQYRQGEREDLTVVFTRAEPARVRHELRALGGVMSAESFRVAPVRARHGHHLRTLTITGLEPGGALRRLVDVRGRVFALPSAGAVLTASLGPALGLRVGDTLAVELLERGGTPRRLPVVGFVDEVFGAGIYMDRRALNRLLYEGDVASGAYLALGGPEVANTGLLVKLKRLPGVSGSTSRRAMIDYFRQTMRESVEIIMGVVVIAAGLIALGVVYNGARIALSERGRELASLRVLGFTRQEVSGILLGEQAVITIGGIAAGFGVGFLFAWALAKGFEAERHRFPLVVESGTYAFSAAIIAAAALFAALIVRRRIDHLDLIAVLKTRE